MVFAAINDFCKKTKRHVLYIYTYIYIYIYIYIYQGSLEAVTIKLTIKQQIWKIKPKIAKIVDETRYRTQERYNRLQ